MAFPQTRLSVVERTRSDDAEQRRVAMDILVDAYWKPVYTYLRLKWSLAPDRAADLTQEFFMSALEKAVIERYDPGKARFRTYLRLCVDGLAANAHKAEQRLKRGGGVVLVPLDVSAAEDDLRALEPSVPADVDDLFYQEWVRSLMAHAIVVLRARAHEMGRPEMFEVFDRYDLREDEAEQPTYAELARALNLTPATVTNHLAAMRRQFRSIILDRLRELTSSDEEFDAEAARLLGTASLRPRASR